MTNVIPLFVISGATLVLMRIRTSYRRLPGYVAIPLAVLVSLLVALLLAAFSAFSLELVLRRPATVGTGVLIILVALNIAISAFVGLVSILVSYHHQTSWRIPTLAFATCIVVVRTMGVFEFPFAPLMLGTGTVVWLVSCWLLRVKQITSPEHVL